MRIEEKETKTGGRTRMDGKHGKYMVVLYTKPADCGGNCLYCIRATEVTRSTVPNEDTLLAKACGWSAGAQMLQRCEDSGIVLHTGNKFELRIKGNSFTNYDMAYLEGFIKEIYDLLNGFVGETFADSFRAQETAKDKCVQIVVETRPDQITHAWCRQMLEWGVRTVELGVQSLSDDVLARNHRGHDTACVRKATKMIRQYGFELGYQVMLGLYGSSDALDREMLCSGLWTREYYPDSLKVYPCLLLPDEEAQKPLYALFHSGDWSPLQDEAYHRFLQEVLPHIPEDVHVNRLQRIFTAQEIAHGVKECIDRGKYSGICRSMWQRSIQNTSKLYLAHDDYRLISFFHDGELCVQAVLEDQTILGYGRLRLCDEFALIRDLRVLGTPLRVGQKPNAPDELQHRGIGRNMLCYMERYAAQQGKRRVLVHASAGCVGYFKKNGYCADNDYTLRKECNPATP